MTKQAFIEAYTALMVAQYEWARDPARLERALEAVRNTLYSRRGQQWDQNGKSTAVAWKAIGCKGRPTLKALRALEG